MIYAPDKGVSYGQAPRARGVRRVWDDVQRFLAACTVAQPPEHVALTAFRATKWDDDATAEACLVRVRKRFGAPDEDERSGGEMWPTGEPVKGGHLRWRGTPERVPELVEFMAAGEPWPKQTLGPVELRVSYRFAWRDPATADRIVAADGSAGVPLSEITITLGRRSFIQPTLWFPYAWTDPRLASLLEALSPCLPFPLLARHLRSATAQPDGSGFRFAKIAQPPRGAT